MSMARRPSLHDFGPGLVRDHPRAFATVLSDRERAVLRFRYGLDGSAPRTCRQVAEAMGISANRVRQLENRAVRKLVEAIP